MAVFMPMMRPTLSSRGPPLLPGLIAASVCMTLLIGRPLGDFTSLPNPETTPMVKVWSKPKGFPMAKASWPTCGRPPAGGEGVGGSAAARIGSFGQQHIVVFETKPRS